MSESEQSTVVLGIIRDNDGDQIGVKAFEDFEAFHENGPEIESREHVGRVELAGERGVIA